MPGTWTEIGNITGPVGPPGTSVGDVRVTGEVPTGAINGSNTNFSLAGSIQSGSLAVYLNGQRLKLTADYTVTGASSFQMVIAPLTGDVLTVDYTIPSSGGGVNEIYVGAKARLVALANGVKLEVQDSGGTWIKQVEYTE